MSCAMKIHRIPPGDIVARALMARRAHKSARRPAAAMRGFWGRTRTRALAYAMKMKGAPRPASMLYPVEIFWSFVGSLIGMGLLSWCNHVLFGRTDNLLLMGTFGASAMLLFGAPAVPFAQPRNVLGGHVISALVGVAVFKLFPDLPSLAAALSVSLAIAAMHATATLHPPGGGTALVMVTSGPAMTDLGFYAALFPTATGAAILVAVALVTNNLSRRRRYPAAWW